MTSVYQIGAASHIVWIVNDTLIHVEIDENGNSHEDDETRLVSIHWASGCKNHICIRFNPDGSPPCLKLQTLCNGERVYSRILIPEIRNIFDECLGGKTVCGKRKLCF